MRSNRYLHACLPTLGKNYGKRWLKNVLKFVAPFIFFINRVRSRRAWVIVLAGRSYSNEIIRHLWQYRYKIFIYYSCPDFFGWRFASAKRMCELGDIGITPEVVSTAEKLGCKFVLIQSGDDLLPVYAKANTDLSDHLIFSRKAIESSLDKGQMRRYCRLAGLSTPIYKE